MTECKLNQHFPNYGLLVANLYIFFKKIKKGRGGLVARYVQEMLKCWVKVKWALFLELQYLSTALIR